MKNKKAQAGSIWIGLTVTVILAVMVISIVWTQWQDQTTVTRVSNDTFTPTNNTCVQVTSDCVSSLKYVYNASNGLAIGLNNFSICKLGGENQGILFEGTAVWESQLMGKNLNATYDEISCSNITGMAGSLLSYIPLMLAIAVLVFVAGFMAFKG